MDKKNIKNSERIHVKSTVSKRRNEVSVELIRLCCTVYDLPAYEAYQQPMPLMSKLTWDGQSYGGKNRNSRC